MFGIRSPLLLPFPNNFKHKPQAWSPFSSACVCTVQSHLLEPGWPLGDTSLKKSHSPWTVLLPTASQATSLNSQPHWTDYQQVAKVVWGLCKSEEVFCFLQPRSLPAAFSVLLIHQILSHYSLPSHQRFLISSLPCLLYAPINDIFFLFGSYPVWHIPYLLPL